MDTQYASSLVDSRSRKRVRFSETELGSDGFQLDAEPSCSRAPSLSSFVPSSSKGKPAPSTPIPFYPTPTYAASSEEVPNRPSIRELFNRLPDSGPPEAKPNLDKTSVRELFNRLPRARQSDERGLQQPSVRDLYNRLPGGPRHSHENDGPKSNLRELFNRLPHPDLPTSKQLPHLSELYFALPPANSPPPVHPSSPKNDPETDNVLDTPKAPVVIDLTSDDDEIPPFERNPKLHEKERISADDNHPADLKAPSPSIFPEYPREYIFNTTDELATRQTKRSWAGSYCPHDWVFGREELHADQVDRDRALPNRLSDTGYPHYVITAREIRGLHMYLAARYQFEDYEAYKHILASYRNTRAIEASKARDRYSKLVSLSKSVERCRQRLIKLFEDQDPT